MAGPFFVDPRTGKQRSGAPKADQESSKSVDKFGEMRCDQAQ